MMRKEAGFEVQDHIRVFQSAHEVLAESITYDGADDTAYTKEWTVNGEKVTLAVKKI